MIRGEMNFLRKEETRQETCQGCKHLYYNCDGSVSCDSSFEKACLNSDSRMYKEVSEEMNGLTSNGYSQILEKIKRTPVLLPEGDLTTDELYRWLTGYKDAMDVVTGILEDFIKVDR